LFSRAGLAYSLLRILRGRGHACVRRRDEGRICKPRFSAHNAIYRKADACATAIAATARDKTAFACAWMANTIVLIAGKRAKFMWRRIMTHDSIRVVFHLDRNPLLVGVLRGAVEFQALQAGLHAETCSEFAKAFEDVCRETLSQFTDADGGLEVTLDTFGDRIEISIHHHGQLVPAIGLERFAFSEALADGTRGLNGLELLSRVDRVGFSTEDGVARTTLVKFLNAKP
jgi:hypothetical protein